MIDFQRKKRIKNIIYSPISIVVLFLVLTLLIKALMSVYLKEITSSENLLREKTEYEKMNSRKTRLTDSIEYLKTDDGVESEIRNKFRLVKEGESVTVIVDNNIATSTPKAPLKENPRKGLQALLYAIMEKL